MAADSKFSAWIIVCVLVFHHMSESTSAATDQCVDGTYDHEGRKCCRCAAGQYLVKHCTVSPEDRICEPCEDKTFSSHPNHQTSCDGCTSCSHASANLEEAEPCTPARDSKCRCKNDHYCITGTETCTLCHPCKVCGAEGIKVACTGNNNTVCNDKIKGGNKTGIIVGILFAIFAVIVLLVCAMIWIKRRMRQQPSGPETNQNDVERQLLKDVDLQPHLHDIAEVIEWKDMHAVATHSKVPKAIIESCMHNHPRDRQAQTLELLSEWVEREGSGASQNLIQSLRNRNRNATADSVMKILSPGS